MSDRQGRVSNAEVGCDFRRPAVKAEGWATARFANHFDFEPVHAPTDAGSQCFSASFLGGKACSEALGRIPFAQAISLFRSGEDAIEEALSEALKRLLDARNFNKINAAADNHAVYQANIPRQVFSLSAGPPRA